MKKVSFKNSNANMLQAFTLFESVVAISIIAVLIGIGSLIYGNLIKAEKPFAYFQAQEAIVQHFKNLNESKAFFNQVYDHQTYTIEQAVDFHRGNKGLYQVKYSAILGSKIILIQIYLVVHE